MASQEATTSVKFALEAVFRLVKLFENFVDSAYLDSQGIWTIGFGTTQYPDGHVVQQFDRCTVEQAEEWCLQRLESSWNQHRDSIPRWDDLPLGYKLALTDLDYNEGYRYRDGDHDTLDKALDSNDLKALARSLRLYRNPGKKDELGLLRRRYADYLMCHGQDPPEAYRIAICINSIPELLALFY